MSDCQEIIWIFFLFWRQNLFKHSEVHLIVDNRKKNPVKWTVKQAQDKKLHKQWAQVQLSAGKKITQKLSEMASNYVTIIQKSKIDNHNRNL